MVLIETEEKTLSGDMEALMKNGTEADSYGGDTTLNGGAEFSFMTTKTISEGSVVLMGTVYYGPESDLLDVDVEAYYTDEDLEKLSEDPDYQPQVQLPSYTEFVLGGIDGAKLQEQQLAGVKVTCGSLTWSSETDNRSCYEYRACGVDGQNLLCITVSANALGCADADAALKQVDELVQGWLGSLKLS